MQNTLNTLTFTGHYEDRGLPRKVVHTVNIKEDIDKVVNTTVNQLLFQIGTVGMIDREGDKWTLIPAHRFSSVEAEISRIALTGGSVVLK